MQGDEIKSLILEAIEESLGVPPVEVADRWKNGTLVLKPGNDSQPKEVPLDVFFKKLIGVRDALRMLEQKVNNHSQLSAEDKVNMQAYLTKAYGSLTTFNILFKDGKDKFVGSGSQKSGSSSAQNMSLKEAQKKLGLNEY
jgi:hypothetical protein